MARNRRTATLDTGVSSSTTYIAGFGALFPNRTCADIIVAQQTTDALRIGLARAPLLQLAFSFCDRGSRRLAVIRIYGSITLIRFTSIIL